MLIPERLQSGDKVGIIVPSSPVKESFRSAGNNKIEELGYLPVEVDDILAGNDFLAKKPGDGFADIQAFFNSREIKAIWAARGGYGSNLLLPLLSRLKIPAPKIVIGSSDVSYLLWYLLDHFETVVFYGPMAYSSLPENRFDSDNFKSVISAGYTDMEIPGSTLISGSARGVITGGCLSNFVSLMGTSYLPVVTQRILLLEDVGERPYRLDRLFWQLAQSGILSTVKGVVLGEFPNCFKDKEEKENLLQRLRDYLNPFGIPVIYDLPFGHSNNIHTLPLGIEVEIDNGGLKFGNWNV
ncbi:MAG: LD-carboxypeptidase [bacterium]|nr:LD-carboxypeptidase [bacterium]